MFSRCSKRTGIFDTVLKKAIRVPSLIPDVRGAHKLPLIRQDQHSITHMPLKIYSAISKPSFARVCESMREVFSVQLRKVLK